MSTTNFYQTEIHVYILLPHYIQFVSVDFLTFAFVICKVWLIPVDTMSITPLVSGGGGGGGLKE